MMALGLFQTKNILNIGFLSKFVIFFFYWLTTALFLNDRTLCYYLIPTSRYFDQWIKG